MKLNRKGSLGLLAAAAVIVGGGSAAFAAVSTTPTTVTAVTHIQNDADRGNGGNWAIEQIDRALTISAVTPNTAPTGSLAYSATVSDTGTFTTVPGAEDPNQVSAVPGHPQFISHVVSGTMTCKATYAIVAPSPGRALNDTSLPNGGLPASINDLNAHITSGPHSFSFWPEQAFTPQLPDTDVTLSHYTCTYVTPAGESWTESDTNGNGNLIQDGNITGLLAPPPVIYRLSHGHGTSTAPTRETVTFQEQPAPAWVEFVIVGPGAINGHKGWVRAVPGLNQGVYSGLVAGHGYTSCYTVVAAQGSQSQVPGSHGGCVYFVSNH